MPEYGGPPVDCGEFPVEFEELCRYLYLPIKMAGGRLDVRLEPRLEFLWPMVSEVIRREAVGPGAYMYLTCVHGWATPDNPLNRPGWHCDGFGTEDINYVWWHGPGTRFAVDRFAGISPDHVDSMSQFDAQIARHAGCIICSHHIQLREYPERHLYRLDPYVVHATPEIERPGCWRSFVKISVSTHRYNLKGNSHNYGFEYNWKMYERSEIRNDPVYGEADYFPEDR